MKPHIKNTIIINLIWLLIAFAVVAIWQDKIIKDNKLVYETDLQYQETRNLEKLAEFTANYNILQSDYNGLYYDHNVLKLKDGWELYTVTAYTSQDEGCNNISAIGLDIEKWSKYFNFVAVDPITIPYGSVLLVKFDTGIKAFTAIDCGNDVKGRRIDLYFGNDKSAAFEFGVQELEVKVIK